MTVSGSIAVAQNEQKLNLYSLKRIFCSQKAVKIKQSETMAHKSLFNC